MSTVEPPSAAAHGRGGRRVPSWLAGLALSAFTTLLLVATAEGLARLFEPAPERREAAPELIRGWQQWDGDFYHFGRSAPRWPPDAEVNRDGLREPHHTQQAPEGTTRLLIFGDSVTYGLSLAPEAAFPRRLQQRLDAAGERLEVFGVAAPGWTTRQQRLAYERLMRPYGARHALLAVCLNDLLELHQNLDRPPAALLALHQRSALVRRLMGAREREVRGVEALMRAPDGAVGRAALARFAEEVRALRSELARDGVALGLVVLPYRFQLLPDAPHPAVQERLAAFARSEGLPFQDLLPALRPLGEAAFLDYNHLSAAGAEAVADALLGGGLLPPRRSYPALLREHGEADRAVAPALLASPRAELRAAAAWRLQGLASDETTARTLAPLVEDPSEAVRLEALRALELGRAAPAEARPALRRALTDAREPVRLAAARALWALAPQVDDAPALVSALGHDDAYLRAFGEEALARLGAPALPTLEAALLHGDAGVRRRAVRLIGRCGSAAAGASPALVQRLADADTGVRRQAARALGELRPRAGEVVAALRRVAAEDADGQVRAAARLSAERLEAERR